MEGLAKDIDLVIQNERLTSEIASLKQQMFALKEEKIESEITVSKAKERRSQFFNGD